MDCGHHFKNSVLLDSKDAKAKVNCDVTPVQRPGKSWRKITTPDHDWKRLAHNSITPVSHLFMETELKVGEDDSSHIEVRTGKAATALNLSHFEPETVERVFNGFFLLLVEPTLDEFFRNPDTGKLKEHFVFIVDNGPSEAPS